MKAYKLDLAFDGLDDIIDFYMKVLCKPQMKALETILSMGMKGQIISNPDGSTTVTWFFRTLPKFNKIADAYLKYKLVPSSYIPAAIKLDYEVSN